MGKRRRRKKDAPAENAGAAQPIATAGAAPSAEPLIKKPAKDGKGGGKKGKGKGRKEEKKDEVAFAERVRRQLDFYFSDANLRRDKFMRATVDAGEGFVELATLLTFNRLKAMKVTEASQLVEAIKKSEMLELNEDGTKVRRDFAKAPKEEMDPVARTIYVEGLPLAFGIDEIAKFFAYYGHVKLVELPHHRETGEPRGFCFVEFALEKEAAAAADATDGTWPTSLQDRHDGKTLRVMSKQRWLKHTQDYRDLQVKSRGSKVAETAPTESASNSASSSVPETEKSTQEPAWLAAVPAHLREAVAALAATAGPPAPATGAEAASSTSKPRSRPGCIVMISGFPQPQTLLSIRQYAEHAVPVEYCDFPDPYGSVAHLRLRCPDDSRVLLEDAQHTHRRLGWLQPQIHVLSTEEEKQYWEDVDRRRAERNAVNSRARPKVVPAGLSKRAQRKLVRPLRAMALNPQGVVKGGPAKTTAIQKWCPGVDESSDGLKASFTDTVGGNGGLVQAGFSKAVLAKQRQRRGRKTSLGAVRELPLGRLRPAPAPVAPGKRPHATVTEDLPPAKARRPGPVATANPTVPPPSPFIMPGGVKPKRAAKPPSTGSQPSSGLPPPSPFAKPTSTSTRPSRPRSPAGLVPPSPVARQAEPDPVPSPEKEESKPAAAEPAGDTLLADADDILGLLDE